VGVAALNWNARTHAPSHPLRDALGRPLASLRLSVTDRCNLRCMYCMPEEHYRWLQQSHLLSFEEFVRLVDIFTSLGVRRVRLTGGEPLLRRDLHRLVSMLSANPLIEDLALTTNGVLLAEQAGPLHRAGLHRVTVSLDTLRPKRFLAVARRNDHARVLAGIAAARRAGFSGTKIDAVIMRGVNDDELSDLIEFGRTNDAEVRFIEYMDVPGATQWAMNNIVSRAEMLAILERRYGPISAVASDSSAPASRFFLSDRTVFGIIASTTEPQWLHLNPTAVTADTPVPFDIRPIWHKLDWENHETRMAKGDPATHCQTDAGDAESLTPAQFRPYNPAGQAPHQGQKYGVYGTMPDLLRLGLLNPQLKFFQEPQGTAEGPDPLVGVIQEWLGRERPISVLDFSGVPTLATDLAIGVVLSLLFEVSIRSQEGGPGVGRASPVLVVLEEAHRYLGENAGTLTRDSANRIAREGRKYGIGLLLVTQRPTELPDTALAQCGTIIALRLSNAEDQGAIRAALPDAVAGLAAVLPSLRTGEAVVSGEAVVLPSRALLDIPDPKPKADDPSLAPWRREPQLPDIAPALADWRGIYEA
jgi:molybdenum cofactor biosynthesis protein A